MGTPNPETVEELRETLRTLLKFAHENGVDLSDRSFSFRFPDLDIPDMEVEFDLIMKK